MAPVELIKSTKAGKHDDSILIGDVAHRGFVANMVANQFRKQWAKGDCMMAPLFPSLTSPKYSAMLSAAFAELGLKHMKFTPHSLRHGRPSTDAYEQVRSLEEIQKRGRWGSPKSVTRYEKHARLLRVFSRVNEATLQEARRASVAVTKAVLHQ